MSPCSARRFSGAAWAAGIIALLGVQTAGTARADWREAPADRQQINMQVPGMENRTPGYSKLVNTDVLNEGTAYNTDWGSGEEYNVLAFLTHQITTRGFHYFRVKDSIEVTVGKHNVFSFDGDKKTYGSKIGDFEYIDFSLGAERALYKCVGFERTSGSRNHHLFGYYCLLGDKPIDDGVVHTMIDSIDLDYEAPN